MMSARGECWLGGVLRVHRREEKCSVTNTILFIIMKINDCMCALIRTVVCILMFREIVRVCWASFKLSSMCACS